CRPGSPSEETSMRSHGARRAALLLLAAALGAPGLRAAEADRKLAGQALMVFENNCARCHHGPKPKSEVEDYDVLDHASLTKRRVDEDKKTFFYVAPKQPDKSLVWQRLSEGSMPPKKVKTRPSDKDKEIIKK